MSKEKENLKKEEKKNKFSDNLFSMLESEDNDEEEEEF